VYAFDGGGSSKLRTYFGGGGGLGSSGDVGESTGAWLSSVDDGDSYPKFSAGNRRGRFVRLGIGRRCKLCRMLGSCCMLPRSAFGFGGGGRNGGLAIVGSCGATSSGVS